MTQTSVNWTSQGRVATRPENSRNRNARLAALLAAATAVALAGCVTSSGLAPHSTVRSADALAATTSLSGTPLAPGWPTAAWWAALGDSQLGELIEEGLRGSPSLDEAAVRSRAAIAVVEVSESARLPEIDVGASSVRELFPGHSLIPPPYAGRWNTLNELKAGLSWELDFWGKNRSAFEQALGEARAAALDAQAARIALSTSIALQYVELERLYLQLDVAHTLLAEREQIYSLTRERNSAGVDSRLELKQAESALPDARERITQLEERIGLTGNALAALLGAGPDRGVEIRRPALESLPSLALPTRLPSELLGRRPDILALRWRIEAAGHGIASAKAQFYPDVNLAALIGLQALGTGAFAVAANREIGIAPAITLPIFDGGWRRGELAARDASYDLAVDEYNQALADALRDVVNQLVAVRSIEAQRAEERDGLATAQDAYDLALLRYRGGIGNYLQVLTTHAQLLAQRSLEADLRAQALTVSINLTRALGGGFEPHAADRAVLVEASQ